MNSDEDKANIWFHEIFFQIDNLFVILQIENWYFFYLHSGQTKII